MVEGYPYRGIWVACMPKSDISNFGESIHDTAELGNTRVRPRNARNVRAACRLLLRSARSMTAAPSRLLSPAISVAIILATPAPVREEFLLPEAPRFGITP
jgi:hypothetical protein